MRDINDLWAKSNGIKLTEHSIWISKLAVFLAERSSLSIDFIETVRISALLHDIGKCLEHTQLYFHSKICQKPTDEYDEYDHNDISHNEISWAFLADILPWDKYNLELNAIYWHHAKRIRSNNKDYKNNQEFLEKISDEDMKMLNKVFIHLTNNTIIPKPIGKRPPINIPPFHQNTTNGDNEKYILCRTCLISADRYISSLSLKDFDRLKNGEISFETIVENIITRNPISYVKPKEYDSKRYDMQLQCALDARLNQTNIVKGTAGIGKTLIGLLWNFSRNNKLIWVGSRNIICESVYLSIIEELKKLQVNRYFGRIIFNLRKKKKSSIPRARRRI